MIKYRNKYRVENNICYIDCFNKYGTVTGTILIDAEDFDKVCQYQWHIEQSREHIQYAQASLRGHTLRLHRLLLSNSPQVDHINHDGLDNRKCNLRSCTNQENNCNKKTNFHPKSGYTGIRYNAKVGSYYVRIMVHKKEISLGHYKSLNDALEARKQGELKYFGTFRYQNQ